MPNRPSPAAAATRSAAPDPYAGSPIPRYLQVADVLRRRIARGQWRQGQQLPSLEALGAEFGVARVTMRQAIELLARDGLLRPQQGRGTFVTGQPAPQRGLNVVTTLDELARVYRGTSVQIVDIDEHAAAPLLRPDDGLPAERYVYMRRVHARDGHAYCVINIHLDERIYRRAPQRFRAETVIPLLTSMKGLRIARARQVLTIGTADLDVARLLGMAVNAPVADVRRVFNDAAGRVVYLADVTYRGDAVHVEMDLAASPT